MNKARRPLLRFWYLPESLQAALILAGDDYGTKDGTHQAFAMLDAESAPGCRVEAWECYRATSYLTRDTAITLDDVKRHQASGFEVGIHADTGCKDQDNIGIAVALSEQVGIFGKQELGIEKQQTHRIHCIPWNGWVHTVKIERDYGIRLSMNCYYWPGYWIQGRQDFMAGQAFPMRFADLNGKVVDVYQAATHIVDENGIDYATGIRFLIDKALGPEQFFGIFGTHYDFKDDFLSLAVAIAKERGIALISAAQALRWLDARSSSRFERITWDQRKLGFDVHVAAGTDKITVMVPQWAPENDIVLVECDGEAKAFQTVNIKGISYALLSVRSGRCNASYENRKSSAAKSPNRLP